MNLRQARGIFRLDSRVTLEDLNGIFRKLVKKYHPDKVRDYPDWAHARMAEINTAYEMLVERLAKPIDEKEAVPAEETHSGEEDNFEIVTDQEDLSPISKRVVGEFYRAFNEFLDGLGIYFQYGLNNPSIRGDGVRRVRFREAVRNIEAGADALYACSKKYKHLAVVTATRFARLTVADINMGELPGSLTGPYHKYEKKMKNARMAFDLAIKDILFPELLPGHLRGIAKDGLYACYSDFITFLIVFENDERQKAGILQAARYDAFMKLLNLRNIGVIKF